MPDGSRAPLAETVIPAGNLLRLRPSPAQPMASDPLWDRQARLMGDPFDKVDAVVGLFEDEALPQHAFQMFVRGSDGGHGRSDLRRSAWRSAF